jgi:small subunit ribosomal protein S8
MNKTLSIIINNIKLGYKYNKLYVKIPNSKLSLEIINKLCKEGYIRSYKFLNNKNIEIFLFYDNYKSLIPMINNIKIISKPGRRIYNNTKELKNNKTRNVMGSYTFLSTPKGYMTQQKALELKQGGEVLFTIN